jgi:hypothetical protein
MIAYNHMPGNNTYIYLAVIERMPVEFEKKMKTTKAQKVHTKAQKRIIIQLIPLCAPS